MDQQVSYLVDIEVIPKATLGVLQGRPHDKFPPSPPHYTQDAAPSGAQKMIFDVFDSFNNCGITLEEIKELFEVRGIISPMISKWRYESRRNAQMILPFLYLGPFSTAKDRQFLRDQGITLLLGIRDLRSAQASLMSGHKVAQELGIASGSVDIENHAELIASFPHVIRVINEHMLAVHRQQAFISGTLNGPNTGKTGLIAANEHAAKRGKVLIFCESGNERSASCVVAYIMAMYSLDGTAAMRYVQSHRFCIALSEELKQLLESFYGVICARQDVRIAFNQVSAEVQNASVSLSGAERIGGTTKRSATDMEGDDEACLDVQRYTGRLNYGPYPHI